MSGMLICLLLTAPLCAFAELPEGMRETVVYAVTKLLEDTAFNKAGDTFVSYPQMEVTPAQLKALCAARGFEVLLPSDETLPEGMRVNPNHITIYIYELPDGFQAPEGEPDWTSEDAASRLEQWNLPSTILAENFRRVTVRVEDEDHRLLYAYQIHPDVPAPEETGIETLENGLIVTEREMHKSRSSVKAVQCVEGTDGKAPMYILYVCKNDVQAAPLDLLAEILEAARPIE